MDKLKQKTALRFHRNAKSYDENALVQRRMAKQILGLSKDKSLKPRRILEIGCGTGGLTSLLASCYPCASITAVDIAPNMIQAARMKSKSPNIEFVCADAENLALDTQFDLIISSACFQWFTSLGKNLCRFYHSLADGGTLAFSTFGEKTFQELHQSFSFAEAALTGKKTCIRRGLVFHPLSFYRVIAGTFQINKLSEQSYSEEDRRYYYQDAMSFLYSIKNIGATFASEASAANPRLIREMSRQYELHYKTFGKVRATYHCQYIVWRKGNAS